MFFYVYTGQVTFSPLVSQGATYKETQKGHSEDEARPPQDREGLGSLPLGSVAAEPCSPKSIYSLANKVCPAPVLDGVDTNSTLYRLDWLDFVMLPSRISSPN